MPDEVAMPAAFIDTNVWLYAFIQADDAQKTAKAQALLQTVQPIVNVQVVNEVCVNLLRRKVFREDEIAQLIASFFAKYQVAPTTEAVLLAASQLRERYSLSFWDSLIVAAATSSGTTTLYTGDMQHGLTIGRLVIVNPFLA